MLLLDYLPPALLSPPGGFQEKFLIISDEEGFWLHLLQSIIADS